MSLSNTPRILVIMGVSGSGKSTVAEGLRDTFGWDFQEGDALHPAANVEKMRSGIPLTDEDRQPWLAACAQWIAAHHLAGTPGILTCSALKKSYRETLSQGFGDVWFVDLEVPEAVLKDRLDHRAGHYMPSSLLKSQLQLLERPGEDEQVIRVQSYGDAAQTLADVIAAINAPR